MTGETKRFAAFLDGVLLGIVAHLSAWFALATLDRFLYILGHIAAAVALRIAERMWPF
jgi:hypothetical protein